MSRRNYNKKNKANITKESVELTSFEGLMPDPETLKDLEDLCPGAAERWQQLAEAEIKERHTNERKIVNSYVLTSLLGFIAAILTVILFVALGAYALYLGYPNAASAIIVGSLAQTIIVFFLRKKNDGR